MTVGGGEATVAAGEGADLLITLLSFHETFQVCIYKRW